MGKKNAFLKIHDEEKRFESITNQKEIEISKFNWSSHKGANGDNPGGNGKVGFFMTLEHTLDSYSQVLTQAAVANKFDGKGGYPPFDGFFLEIRENKKQVGLIKMSEVTVTQYTTKSVGDSEGGHRGVFTINFKEFNSSFSKAKDQKWSVLTEGREYHGPATAEG